MRTIGAWIGAMVITTANKSTNGIGHERPLTA